MEIHGLECCGLREISGLIEFTTPKAAMREVCEQIFDMLYGEIPSMANCLNEFNFSHVIFSEARTARRIGTPEHYGTDFAAFITANALGSLVTGPRVRNPNSESMLKVWLWTVNRRALILWYRAQLRAER